MSDEKDIDDARKNDAADTQNDNGARDVSFDAFLPKVQNAQDNESVPLWLVTFTDVMALMLTFFVLLYSMSVPQVEKWEDLTEAISSRLSKLEGSPFTEGTQDAINIYRIDPSNALALGYLKTLLRQLLKHHQIEDVVIFENANRLVVSLPSVLFFEEASAEMRPEGKKILFILGGALTRIQNRIEVVGHADPQPISGGRYSNNWELSLARGASVAMVLSNVGYDRNITVRGLSSGRFDELPRDVDQDTRYSLSRRVDIVIMDDDGVKQQWFNQR